jgi:hypothetical protein
MDGAIGLILKRVQDVNFNTKNLHVIFLKKLFLLFAFERNDKYLKLNISSLFLGIFLYEVIFWENILDKSAFFSSI